MNYPAASLGVWTRGAIKAARKEATQAYFQYVEEPMTKPTMMAL